jgi:hypothetical protein
MRRRSADVDSLIPYRRGVYWWKIKNENDDPHFMEIKRVDAMARDGMTTFSDIAGKLEMLRVECEKCGRKGQYRVMRLMKELGPEATLWGFIETVTTNCERRKKKDIRDPCRTGCPDLPKVLGQRWGRRASV